MSDVPTGSIIKKLSSFADDNTVVAREDSKSDTASAVEIKSERQFVSKSV